MLFSLLLEWRSDKAIHNWPTAAVIAEAIRVRLAELHLAFPYEFVAVTCLEDLRLSTSSIEMRWVF